jgi:hypothetical protein
MALSSAQIFGVQPRNKTQISRKLENRIAAYISVAGATGVGLLALAQPAEAKIIYTAANISVTPNVSIPIDFNGDGVTDVYVSYFNHNFGSHQSFSFGMQASAPAGNGVRVKKPPQVKFPAALFFGAPIGPGGTFASGPGPMDFCFGNSANSSCGGYFHSVNTQTKYLGVQFKISGQTYYGWVRIQIAALQLTGAITGYAYEDAPNTPIKAGALHEAPAGSEKPAALTPASPAPRQSLGALAIGSSGISIWRGEENSETAAPTP